MREITITESGVDSSATGPTLGQDTRQHLGRQLQAVFADLEGEPLPNDHIDLLLALRRRERETARAKS
jgi:hypothetical protein